VNQISEDEEDTAERERLLAEFVSLNAEIRRRLLALVEHPEISEEFRENSRIKDWTK
jgi:hypothetical protein